MDNTQLRYWPGATPKTEADWPHPPWLPETPDDWGAWEGEAGLWHSAHLDGGSGKIEICEPFEPRDTVMLTATISVNYKASHAFTYCTAETYLTRLSEALAFVGLDLGLPAVSFGGDDE